MPCYDVKWLEPKTHVELDPGESIEYTKYMVSLRCQVSSHKDAWCQYSLWTDQAKEGTWTMSVKWTRKIAIKQKGLWPAPQGHPGCETLQMRDDKGEGWKLLVHVNLHLCVSLSTSNEA